VGRQPVHGSDASTRAVRILQVVASYLPAVRYGGTIVSVHGLSRALAARGHDVHVFTTSVDGAGDSDVAHGVPVNIDGVSVWYFRSRHLRRVYYSAPLGAALRDQLPQFDVLHTHAIYLWPLWRAASQARADGVPYVVSPRGMLEKSLIERKSALWKAALIGFVERRTLEGASAIHVTSRREAEQAQAFGFNLPPLVEIPNGVEIEVADAAAPSPAIAALMTGAPFVLFLGRINWKKGLDRLIAALAQAPEARVIVAGNDEEQYGRQLVAQAERLGVSDRIHFAGAVDGADKAALLKSARALVLPSYSENFGNVVVEAWAAGRPVIVTPEVGLADYIAEAGGGWVVEGSATALGRQLVTACTDAALCARTGSVGRMLVEKDFTWAAVAQKMEAAYASIIQQRGQA
jgi:glycosyltransferase involved in cell wall biosynthesis